MTASVERFVQRIREAEEDLTREVEEQQRRWHFRLHRGRVWFDQEVRHAHERFRQSIPAFLGEASLPILLTAPITYSLILPLLLLDIWATLYQWVCFPFTGSPSCAAGTTSLSTATSSPI